MGLLLPHYTRPHTEILTVPRHALSIDENRKRFPRVGWANSGDTHEQNRGPLKWLKQEWFAGNHSDIGGSYPEDESRLSDIALQWMVDELKSIPNQPLVDDRFVQTFPDPLGIQHDEVRASRELWPRFWPTWAKFGWSAETRKIHPEAVLHESVLGRFAAASVSQYDQRAPYRPENLRGHVNTSGYYATCDLSHEKY